MSTIISLTIEKCTKSEKGGAILKLVNKQDKSIDTAFGKKTAGVQQTFYMKVDAEQPIGKVGDLDLGLFNIVERPFKIEDPSSEMNGQDVMLKWLHIK